MKDWKEVDGRATDTMNEAKDNVKFLSILERQCSPLYDNDPVCMISPFPVNCVFYFRDSSCTLFYVL